MAHLKSRRRPRHALALAVCGAVVAVASLGCDLWGSGTGDDGAADSIPVWPVSTPGRAVTADDRRAPRFNRVTFAPGFLTSRDAVYVSPDGSDHPDGSRANPYRSLWVATEAAAARGARVLLLPGRYDYGLSVNGSGAELLPLTTGVWVEGSRVYFPAETDLDVVVAGAGDFVYVFRSRCSNNGVHQVTAVGSNYVETATTFHSESGTIGEDLALSAAVGRPLVVAPAEAGTVEIGDSFYIEKHHWTLITGFRVRNSAESFNIQNGGSYHVFYNNRIENVTEMNGLQVGVSTADDPSVYNVLANNLIVNPTVEGVYIGAGGQGPSNNHTDFTHVLANEITMTNGNRLENGIDLKEYNRGSVVEGNWLHGFELMSGGNGAVDVRDEHDGVLLYRNRFENIRGRPSDSELYQPYLLTYDAAGLEVFNNEFVLDDGVDGNGIHCWHSTASSPHGSVRFVHNTVSGDFGYALMVDNTGGAMTVANNAFAVPRPAVVYKTGADVTAANNAYLESADADGRAWAGDAGDAETNPATIQSFGFLGTGEDALRPQATSPLVGAASTEHMVTLDMADTRRATPATIGAWEPVP